MRPKYIRPKIHNYQSATKSSPGSYVGNQMHLLAKALAYRWEGCCTFILTTVILGRGNGKINKASHFPNLYNTKASLTDLIQFCVFQSVPVPSLKTQPFSITGSLH